MSLVAGKTTQNGEAGLGNDRSILELLGKGSTTLGAAALAERGLGFFANLLAARRAGPVSYGAYSLVLATSNMIAGFAGMGMDNTAARYTAEYPPNNSLHRTAVYTLYAVCLLAAFAGSGLTLVTAGPLARHILGRPELTNLLRVAAILVAVTICSGCWRGILLGQLRYRGLLLLSAISGGTLLALLPLASRLGPGYMLVANAGATFAALCGGLAAGGRLGLFPGARKLHGERWASLSLIGPVLSYSAVQLTSTSGIGLAGWWLASLVARADNSLVQVGMYAIANQLRNLCSILPVMVAQASFPLLTDQKARDFGGVGRTLEITTLLVAVLAWAVTAPAIVLLPWLLPLLYGPAYAAAQSACLLACATAIAHSVGIPVAVRLSFKRPKSTSLINLLWAGVAIGLAQLLVPRAAAAGACGALLVAHLFSHWMVLAQMRRDASSLNSVVGLTMFLQAATIAFAALGTWRHSSPNPGLPTAAMVVLMIAALVSLGRFSPHAGLGPLSWKAVISQTRGVLGRR